MFQVSFRQVILDVNNCLKSVYTRTLKPRRRDVKSELLNNFNASKSRYINTTNICVAELKNDGSYGKLEVEPYENNYAVPPSHAQVVICGGGLIGCSVAYHLAKLGWTDLVLLDQSSFNESNLSWSLHSSGILGQDKPSSSESSLCRYSIKLFQELDKNGLKTGWQQCGSLHLARCKDRVLAFKRKSAALEASGIECSLLDPKEVLQKCSYLRVDDLLAALWIPGDGVGDPRATCLTLAAEAKKKGVRVILDCKVNEVCVSNDRVTEVKSTKGNIKCEYFVNCGGIWARQIGKLSNPVVRVPVQPVEQYYLHTKPVNGIDNNMPVIRDYDGHIYVRAVNGRFLAGGFDPVAKPVYYKDLMDNPKLSEDWDHFRVMLQEMLYRCPLMENAFLERLCNFPDGYTPDGKWILGESLEVKNYFVAAGMKTLGLAASGGVGKVIADWMVTGDPQMDVWELDIRRFLPLHSNRMFLKDRVTEVPGNYSRINYPNLENRTGRHLRMSPIYPRLKAAGAVFGQIMGYERPNYFNRPEHGQVVDVEQQIKGTFGKPDWFDNVKREYTACRHGVAIVDYSSFTKLELWSKDTEVVDLLQYLCSNDVDVPVGSVIHTGLQNHLGGYENDCSLIRLATNSYMLIAPTIQQTRSRKWLSNHLPSKGKVTLSDVTSMYTAICMMGPFAPDLMAELSDEPTDIQSFPFFTYKEMSVAMASNVRVMRLTHTGEQGWVLYIPNEYALHVYDNLIEHGRKYNLQLAGNYANRSLRIERFYAYWGLDLHTMATPIESGRAFRVKFDKNIDFIGKEALLKQHRNGVTKRYVQLIIENHDMDADQWPWGHEPIYLGDKCVGMTTSTCYGFTLQKQVCLGFVQHLDDNGDALPITNDYILSNRFDVDIAGKRFAAKANLFSKLLTPMTSDKPASDGTYLATQ